jgi:TusA-related sulfurtransferase
MSSNIRNKIDLHGVACPMNFVRTKAALASLSSGELLEVILDEGDAILNVPRSVKEKGIRW